ncbi:MAG: hypothetical protein DRI97_06650 [Bacteroidetes bacterium]|nr:MAG: hypothetical protein DRI97_06650 [Bacteroidota bacterium]RLD87007.1 MAG: hypothetical protein DRJ29_18500 [Bacteroidota bacterium]
MDLKNTKSISFLLLLMLSLSFSCKRSNNVEEVIGSESKPETVVKRRDDGSVSSVNQVNENNRVHGVRATYYEDGKTLYSKQTYDRGKKQGPATWYYMNGKVFKRTNFEDGKRHGLTRVYYKDGSLSAEFESENGNVLPGLKEYKEDGSLVTSYPEIQFKEIDLIASKSRLDLEMSCKKKRSGVKFFILHEKDGVTSRVYLITKDDKALLQFYVRPGEVLDREVDILAEIPTELGNILARKYSYQLSVSN